jgi:hypothetical protein
MKNVVFGDIKTHFIPQTKHITSPLQRPAGKCYVRFEVFTAATTKDAVFWDVKIIWVGYNAKHRSLSHWKVTSASNSVQIHRVSLVLASRLYFCGLCCLHLQSRRVKIQCVTRTLGECVQNAGSPTQRNNNFMRTSDFVTLFCNICRQELK